jgi:hypothetical protein
MARDALKQKVMEVKQRYSPSTLLIENSPISRGLIQSLRQKSINVTVYKPDTDKRARLISQIDLFAGGSVRFPRRAGWLEDFTAELLASLSPRRSDRCSHPGPGMEPGETRRIFGWLRQGTDLTLCRHLLMRGFEVVCARSPHPC